MYQKSKEMRSKYAVYDDRRLIFQLCFLREQCRRAITFVLVRSDRSFKDYQVCAMPVTYRDG